MKNIVTSKLYSMLKLDEKKGYNCWYLYVVWGQYATSFE